MVYIVLPTLPQASMRQVVLVATQGETQEIKIQCLLNINNNHKSIVINKYMDSKELGLTLKVKRV